MTIFSSCALIFNKSYDLVRVNSSPNAILINRKDTLVSDSTGRANLRVPRQAIDVDILVKEKADSFYYKLILKHQLDEIYYFNFFNYGIGYLVDLSTYKKWGYPENVCTYKGKYAKPKIEQVKIQDKPDLPEGQIRADISFPYFNWFYFDAIKPQHQFGFIGLSYGFDYIYGNNKFLNFKVSAATDNSTFIPVEIDDGRFDTSAYRRKSNKNYSLWLSLMNFHQIGIMSLGYGLNFGHNFSSVYIENNNPIAKVYSNANSDAAYNTFGSQFSVYFSLFKYCQIGLIYRPTFYCPYQMDNFIYEHLISIDFGLKIPNNQKTKKK